MVTIYHNPRCSKSRAALAHLTEQSIDTDVVEYLKEPPTADELRRIVGLLGLRARDLIRTNEAPYRDLGLDDPSLHDDALIAAMAAHPILIQRPIVIADGKAVIGRPPERVLEVL